MNNLTVHKETIKRIAHALDELNEQVIYVGGAAVGLYINDPAADDVRPTKDIDISLSIITFAELEAFREALINKGFIQTAEDDVICRFRYQEIILDVMNTKAIAWAPANPWFAPGFPYREEIDIDGKGIRILPLPYFLATKFCAYNSRGNNEPRSSHDFEDIVYIMDNRTDLAERIHKAHGEVKEFLISEFGLILSQTIKQEAVWANLYSVDRDKRYNIIMDTIKRIVSANA